MQYLSLFPPWLQYIGQLAIICSHIPMPSLFSQKVDGKFLLSHPWSCTKVWRFSFLHIHCSLVCEKAVGVHTRNIFLHILVRIPVVGFMFFCALAVPFFGPINTVLGSLGVAIGMYIIPPIAFLVTSCTKSARESSLVKPPPFLPT